MSQRFSDGGSTPPASTIQQFCNHSIRGTTPSRGEKRFHLEAYRKELAPCLRLGSSVVVGIVPSVNGSEKVFEDEIRYLAAQPLASGEVGAEVHAAENAA